jgi:hypothetical protein
VSINGGLNSINGSILSYNPECFSLCGGIISNENNVSPLQLLYVVLLSFPTLRRRGELP